MITVSAPGQPFSTAYQITTTTTPPDSWRLQAVTVNQAAVQSGDTVRVEFYARRVSGSSPRIDLAVQRRDNWGALLFQTISPAANWQKFTYEFVAPAGFAPNGLQIAFNVGFASQVVQIGGVSWRVTSSQISVTDLPFQTPPTNYGGRDGTAGWRSEADARIAASRTAPLTVTVRDANGNLLHGAQVSIRQQKHQFLFGSAISGYDNLLSNSGANPNAARYQALIKRLFNAAVIENNLKWPDFYWHRQLGIDAANWVKSNGMYLRGHNIVWPSRSYMPSYVWSTYDSTLASQGATAAANYLRNEIANRVRDAATTFRGIVDEWDVVNEPFANRDVMNILGNGVVLDWYRDVRTHAPNVRRALNDYEIFAKNGMYTQHRADFEYWLTQLINNNLIEVIGEQSHYNDGNLTYIPVLGQLIADYRSRFNLAIAITEFDVDTKDPQLQADYLRDYYRMAFSQSGVDQLFMWGFWSGSHWLPDAALYDQNFNIKPNGQAYEDLVFGNWWTDTTATTRADGRVTANAFLGQYQVSVEYTNASGQILRGTATVTVNAGGASVTVTVS